MDAYILNKSVGPFSAGTRVIVRRESNSDGTITVEVMTKPNKTISFEDLFFDIEPEYVTKLRSRESDAIVENRAQRRAKKHQAENLVNSLMQK